MTKSFKLSVNKWFYKFRKSLHLTFGPLHGPEIIAANFGAESSIPRSITKKTIEMGVKIEKHHSSPIQFDVIMHNPRAKDKKVKTQQQVRISR